MRKLFIEEDHTDDTLELELGDTVNKKTDSDDAMWGFHNLRIYLNVCHQSCLTCSDSESCDSCVTNATSLGAGKIC